MTYPVKTYPNYITPHGEYEIIQGRIPEVTLTSWDASTEFYLMGGRSIVDCINPDSLRLKGIKGLFTPWKAIDQKGATQDGVTFVTALGDPIKIEATVEARGKTPQRCREVVNSLTASLDSIRTGRLSFYTHEQGRWWADVRLIDPPDDELGKIQTARQRLTLNLRVDDSFWRTYDDTDSFGFAFDDMVEEFSTDYSDEQNLGPNWPQYYDGVGVGYCYANGDRAIWNDDPESIFFTGTKSVVCGPYDGYVAPANDVDVSITFNNTPEYASGAGAANDIWARMGQDEDGLWDGYGIRARIGWGYIRISYFLDFTEHVLSNTLALIPPLANEVWTLRCTGRVFQVRRDGATVREVTESGTSSFLGADYRGVGFGLQGGAAVITQATPGAIKIITSGAMSDTFGTNYSPGLGANWPLYYIGRGDAFVRAQGGNAEWIDNAQTETQTVVNGPYKDFETETNNQVIKMVLGSWQEWSWPDSGANDLWGRMGVDGDDWDGNGIRARIEGSVVTLTRFNDFVATTMRTRNMIIPPFADEEYTLICGDEGNERVFRIQRNGLEVLYHKETDEGSELGADFRGVGFGMQAGGAWINQATPASLKRLSAGDNATVTQTGFLHRRNIGTQPMFDDYTVFGPGTFRFWNGPNATDYVEFGPLLPNQIMYLRTHPGRRSVEDLTVTPPTPQQLTFFQEALEQFLSFAFANNVPPLIQAIVSLFGIMPPQGNPYSLLHGRWSDAAAIPPRSPGNPVEVYSVKVSIDDGNVHSKIIASGTPRRRYPM